MLASIIIPAIFVLSCVLSEAQGKDFITCNFEAGTCDYHFPSSNGWKREKGQDHTNGKSGGYYLMYEGRDNKASSFFSYDFQFQTTKCISLWVWLSKGEAFVKAGMGGRGVAPEDIYKNFHFDKVNQWVKLEKTVNRKDNMYFFVESNPKTGSIIKVDDIQLKDGAC